MAEVWLHPNRRALWFGSVPPVLAVLIGLGLVTSGDDTSLGLIRWIGGALVLVGAVLAVAVLSQLRRPRIAFEDGRVRFYLRKGPPLDVPVRTVEAFFLGQGPAFPTQDEDDERSGQAVNLVARLSRRNDDWMHRDVKPALGHWCDGYVTIRGTWCEPLGEEVVHRLNRRLSEVSKS